jgi:hypothetical protein
MPAQLRDKYLRVSANAETEDHASPRYAMPALLGRAGLDQLLPDHYHLCLGQADQLIQIYFDNVNPFLRTFNPQVFLTELDQFRLGKHPQAHVFSGLLFSIYGLAPVSLSPSTVKVLFSVAQVWLLKNFQEAQELALQQAEFVNSNGQAVFQNLLLYLVRFPTPRGRAVLTSLCLPNTFLFGQGYHDIYSRALGGLLPSYLITAPNKILILLAHDRRLLDNNFSS